MSGNLPTSHLPQRLGIDIDGVLADFTYPVAARASQMFDMGVSGYATHWNWMRDYGVVDERERELWTYLTAHPEWWGGLPPLPGAADALARLHALNETGYVDIYFVTTRPGAGVKRATEIWLQSHGFLTPTVCLAGRKGPVAEGLHLDFFIDDKPENCYDVRSYVKHLYMPDRPWNTDQPTRNTCAAYRIRRCDGIGDALTLAGFPQ